MFTNLINWLQGIWMPIHGMLGSVLWYVPNLLCALLVLCLGGLLASMVSTLLTSVLHKIKFDDLFKGLGLSKILTTGGIKGGLSETIGFVMHWVLMLGVLASALNIMDVPVAGLLLERVLRYVPGVLAAMFVMVVGIVTSKFFTSVITLVSKNVHFDEFPLINTVVKYAIVIFSGFLALQQLNIDMLVIHQMLMYLFAATCLGIAIAYGIRKGTVGKDLDFTSLLHL